MSFTFAPITAADLDAVLAVQAHCYPPAMQEPGPVVLQRIGVAGPTSLVARDAGGAVCAYVFAFPCRRGYVTPLNAGFTLPDDADALYVHDLAVAPAALGRGLGKAMVRQLWALAQARGLRHSALVSVQDSLRFWQSLGYLPAPGDPAALATYPDVAIYMTRALDAG